MIATLSPDQTALMTRILQRIKASHRKPSTIEMRLALRANDMEISLEDLKEWLAEHENDPTQEDSIGAKFTTKPATAIDPGVDEEMKGAEKEMTTNGNATQRTWLDDTEDMLDGDFVKFDDGDEKVLKVVRNPIAGPIEFTQPDGTKKSNEGLNIEVLVGENPKIKTWSVTSKSLMQQIKAICLKERLGPELAGSTLRVTASGTGMQRKYFVKLLARPGQAAPQQPAPQQADPGQQWLQGAAGAR